MGKYVPRAESAGQLKGPLVFLDPDDAVLVEDPNAALYDERVNKPVNEALVSSLRAFGVIEPCVGRRDGDRVEIIDGRGRVRALREANRINQTCGQPPLRLPVVLRDASDQEAAAVAVSANEIRWGDSPLAKGRKAQRLVQLGYRQTEVAKIFGASKTSVSIWLSFLRLTPELQARLERGDLPFVEAVRLARLPREDQARAAKDAEDRRTREKDSSEGAVPTASEPGPRAGAKEAASEFEAEAPPDEAGANEPPTAAPSARAQPGLSMVRNKLKRLALFVVEKDREAVPAAVCVVLLWLMDEATDADLVEAYPRLNRFLLA